MFVFLFGLSFVGLSFFFFFFFFFLILFSLSLSRRVRSSCCLSVMLKSGVLIFKRKDVQATLDVKAGTFSYAPLNKPQKLKSLRVDARLVHAADEHDGLFPFVVDGLTFASKSAVETADWIGALRGIEQLRSMDSQRSLEVQQKQQHLAEVGALFQPPRPSDGLSATIRIAEDEIFRHDRAAKNYVQTTSPTPPTLGRGDKQQVGARGVPASDQPIAISGEIHWSDPQTTIHLAERALRDPGAVERVLGVARDGLNGKKLKILAREKKNVENIGLRARWA